ncbi:MAG TPA: phosphotransferase [Polyangiales bacterium]|nr:phosphotransferase [Polyangiales bacterium]
MQPLVSSAPDLHYLEQALARAGVRSSSAIDVAIEPLDGGRTGASVTRLTTLAAGGERRSFVLKVVPAKPWRASLGMDSVEARLWLSAATQMLPAGLRCPTIDVAAHATSGDWWILMQDVSHGILPRGAYDETKAHALLRALARMHARYWGRDDELAALPLASFEASADALAALSAHVARGDAAAEPWLAGIAQDFRVNGAMLPLFLDALPPADADFYLQLCCDHARISRALARYPRTLLHGDLRRANIAFVDRDVVLFDWELASCGPAARDLQWYWFLQFWAYPPRDGRTPDDRRGGLGEYLESLERARGCEIDRDGFDQSCELAWLSVFCQIGFCLADPLTDSAPSADAIARAKRTSAEAIELARRLEERHVR